MIARWRSVAPAVKAANIGARPMGSTMTKIVAKAAAKSVNIGEAYLAGENLASA